MAASGKAEGPDALVSQLERLNNLIALSLVRERTPQEQIVTLANAGFSNAEIAKLLDANPSTVGVTLHRTRKKADSAS